MSRVNRDVLDTIRDKYDKAIIDEIHNWNFDWDVIFLQYNNEEISQTLTEKVSHVLDRIGATKNGLGHAMDIDKEYTKKHPYDNSPEKNLKLLNQKQAKLNKEIKFQQARITKKEDTN